jgi:hypothetical protein
LNTFKKGVREVSMLFVRVVVAGVWIYQGLWCKLLGRTARHEALVGRAPFLAPPAAHLTMLALGVTECLLAVWVLVGWRPLAAWISQCLLLAAMNAGGLLWARELIPDPAGMVVQNVAFLTLAGVGAYAIHN